MIRLFIWTEIILEIDLTETINNVVMVHKSILLFNNDNNNINNIVCFNIFMRC